MESPRELRERAEHYRHLAGRVTDRQALKALHDLAIRYEALAAELEASPSSRPERRDG
jgi:hypothetical protein